ELCRRSDGLLRDVEQRPGRGATTRRCGSEGRTHHWRGLYAPRGANPFARSRGRYMRIRVGRQCVAQAAVRAFVGRVAGVRVFPEIVDGKNQTERSRDCEHGKWSKSRAAKQTTVGRDSAGRNTVGEDGSDIEQGERRLKL